MSVNVTALTYFQRKAKRLTKKFRTLDGELADLIASLKTTPAKAKTLELGFTKSGLPARAKALAKAVASAL